MGILIVFMSNIILRFSINEYLPFLHAYFTHIRMLSGALVVVVVNYCFTSLFDTNGHLSDIVIRQKRCSQLRAFSFTRPIRGFVDTTGVKNCLVRLEHS